MDRDTQRCAINTRLLLDSGYIVFMFLYWGQDDDTVAYTGVCASIKSSLVLGLLCNISRRHPNQANHNGFTQSKDVLLFHGRGDLRSVW